MPHRLTVFKERGIDTIGTTISLSPLGNTPSPLAVSIMSTSRLSDDEGLDPAHYVYVLNNILSTTF